MKAARILAALFALALPTQLFAVSGTPVYDSTLTPAGYEQIIELSAASGLTFPTNTKLTLIQAEGDDLRWRDDGTSPTASVGMIIADGQTLVYTGDPSAIELIETTADAGKANISYYR